MYLEIINRIPTRAPDRPVLAYGVLRIQPRPRPVSRVQDYLLSIHLSIYLHSIYLSGFWAMENHNHLLTYMHIYRQRYWGRPGHYRGLQYLS